MKLYSSDVALLGHKELPKKFYSHYSYVKGIVEWEFFFRKKLGNCTLMNEQKKIFGLGPFLGLF